MGAVTRFLLVCAAVLAVPTIAAAQPSSLTFEVESTQGWQPTTLMVRQGQMLSLSAVGKWNVDYRNFPDVGPEGYSPGDDAKIYQGCKLDSTITYGLLLVKMGNDPYFELVGQGGEFIASYDGPVSFRIHDADACLGDNAGSLMVTITGERLSNVAPAPVFYCLGSEMCRPVASAPLTIDSTTIPDTASNFMSSPHALECIAGTTKVTGLILAGFDFLGRLWNNTELGPSSPTGLSDLRYWKVIAQALSGALTNYGIDELTKKSCFEWAAELTNDPDAVRNLFNTGIQPVK